MVEPGFFLLEYRQNWQSSDWALIDEAFAVRLDEIEQRVMGGHYSFFEN